MDSPFIEVTGSDELAKWDIEACIRHLKKVARCYRFRVIEVAWVVSPESSLEPKDRGPNIVHHPCNSPPKCYHTIKPALEERREGTVDPETLSISQNNTGDYARIVLCGQ